MTREVMLDKSSHFYRIFASKGPYIMKLTIAFVLGLSLFVSASHGQTQHAPTNRLSNQLQAQADTAWQLVNIGSNTNVYSIDFINADTGWIAGGAGLFMTTDSGNTWLPWGPAGSYRKVQFLNSQIGWVLQSLSSSGMIHTTNGGLTWTNESLRYSPKDVYFINADTGIACRVGEASRTTDGGAHWVDSAVDADNQLCKILSFDQSHLLIVGEPSVWEKQFQLPPVTVFLYSSDAGLTWNRVKFDSAHRALRTGTIHNSKEAIVAGDSIVGHTTDGGQSWTFLSESDILQFASCIVTGDKWYVAGETAFTGSSRILVSTDQGSCFLNPTYRVGRKRGRRVTSYYNRRILVGGFNSIQAKPPSPGLPKSLTKTTSIRLRPSKSRINDA